MTDHFNPWDLPPWLAAVLFGLMLALVYLTRVLF